MKKHNSFKILAAILSACLTMNLAFTAAMAEEYTAGGDHSGVNAALPEAEENSDGSKQKPPVSDESKADTDAASGQRNGGASPLGQVTNTGEFDETLIIDKGAVQIYSDTGRAYLDLENDTVLNGSGLIYYTPPSEEGGPALLKLVDVCVKDDAEAMLVIECEKDIPVVVEVEGENSVELIWSSEVTLTGTGKLKKMRLTSTAFSKGDFTGELNAFTAVCAIVSEGTGLYIKYDCTVYGNYVETASHDMPIAAYSEEEGAILICTFTISEGASYTVSEGVSVIFYNLGENYEDYLSIQGDFINNGSLVYASETPLSEPQKLFDLLDLSGDGLVFVSEELDSVDNADIYNNDGFVSGGVIDAPSLEIDETVTEKTFYVLEYGGRIYYTPPTEKGEPARLKLSEVNPMYFSSFFISYTSDIPVILETEGDNYLGSLLCFPGEITLTGNGALSALMIMTSDFTVAEDFTGDLNAIVANTVISGNIIESVGTVYGRCLAIGETDIAGIAEEDGITQKYKFVLPADAEYNVDYDAVAVISDVGNDYGDYLEINGTFINDGVVLYTGSTFPDDPEEFIRNLKLTGTGYVVIRYDSGEVCYSNDGLRLTYTAGDLDLEDNESLRGDHIDEHGYSFNESEDGSYVLTLKDFSTPYQVTLPGDKPVIINSSGACYIGELSISQKNSIPVTFEGDGELTVNDRLNFNDSCQIIVAEGARVTTNSGVTAYEGVGQIIVNGSYTAICGSDRYDEAVLADCIRIGPDGIMNVRGRRGVCLYRDSDADYPSFFIEEGGRFIADCGEYGLAICKSDSIDGTVSIPEGYLPHGYVFVKAEDSMFDHNCMILALEGSEIVFGSYMREIVSGEGAEGYIVLHPHSEDYDKFIPDPENPEQHIKSCSNDPEHSDSAAPHAFGDWEYADEAGREGEHKHTCEECGYAEYEECTGGAATCEKGKLCETCGHEYSDPLGHDLGKWTYDGNGGHTQKCSRCDYTKTEQCTWGEWVQTKDPTETETGLKIRTCTVCGGEESEVVPVVEPDPDDPDPDNPDPDNPNPDNPDPDNPDPDNPDPDDPDKDTTLTDNKTGVSVSGAIPKGAELLVTIDTENSTASRLYFDISLVKDGQKCQPEGKVTVKIPVPEEMRDIAETLKVYHFADEKYTNMNARLEDGCLVFETDHFSVYVVTADVIEEDDNNGDNTTDQEPEPVIKPGTGGFRVPETAAESSADTTSAPKPSETTDAAGENGTAGENGASDENGTAAETGGTAPNEASTAAVPDNGNSEQPVSADIADNGTENTGSSGAANGSAEENNPNTGLGMAVIPLFIVFASASLIIYNKKK